MKGAVFAEYEIKEGFRNQDPRFRGWNRKREKQGV
jgi:hypothetical protein